MTKPKNHRKTWSKEDVKKLRELSKINKTTDTPTRVIGIKLWRSPSSVRSKAAELNISLRPNNRSPRPSKKK